LSNDLKSRYEAGIELAQKAAKIAMGYYETALDIEWKNDESPVTVADREAEKFLRSSLNKYFKHDGFLGEEYDDEPGDSGYRWIIDPIDGTRNFVRGIPIWATLLGLEYKGEMLAGITVAPGLNQTYRALRGDGAFRNDIKINVSTINSLGASQLFYSSISWFVKAGMEKEFLALASATEKQRGFGDFYGFVLVAQGAGEIMIEHGVHAWDVASIIPLIEEAGGKFSDWKGNKSIYAPDVLVTNGILHQQILDRLANKIQR
jgi:histidinol-phosphatase